MGGLDVLDELHDVLEARAALRAHLAPLPLSLPQSPGSSRRSGRDRDRGRDRSRARDRALWVGAPHVLVERAAAEIDEAAEGTTGRRVGGGCS